MRPITQFLLLSGPTGGIAYAVISELEVDMATFEAELPAPIEAELPEPIEVELPEPTEVETC